MSSTTTQARAAQEAAEWAQVRRELGGELDALEREVQQASVGVTTSTPPAVTPSYSAAADIGKTAASNFTAWRESAPAVASEAVEAPKKKICCACPDTRKPRDECVMMKGEEQCADFIEAHKRCLRAEGFDV